MIDIKKLRKTVELLHSWKAPKPWWTTVDYNEYQIMLAIVLSNRTSYKQVRMFLEKFTRRCPDFDCIASKTLEELEAELKPLGMAKLRARLLKNLADIVRRVGGVRAFLRLHPERARRLLLQVTGIGPKTADMILVALFNQRYFIVDAHILRIMKRLGVLGPEVDDLYEARALLEPYIPEPVRTEVHTKLVILGQTICKPSNPKCTKCILREVCSFDSSS